MKAKLKSCILRVQYLSDLGLLPLNDITTGNLPWLMKIHDADVVVVVHSPEVEVNNDCLRG